MQIKIDINNYYLGDIGDNAFPELNTERSRNERGRERVGAIVLKGIAGII